MRLPAQEDDAELDLSGVYEVVLWLLEQLVVFVLRVAAHTAFWLLCVLAVVIAAFALWRRLTGAEEDEDGAAPDAGAGLGGFRWVEEDRDQS